MELTVEEQRMFNGEAEGVKTAKALLTGGFGVLFLGVEIALGAIIPLLILLRSKASSVKRIHDSNRFITSRPLIVRLCVHSDKQFQ